MAFESVRMRDAHATQPHVIARRERVDVEARAGARLENRPRIAQQPLGKRDIGECNGIEIIVRQRDEPEAEPPKLHNLSDHRVARTS